MMGYIKEEEIVKNNIKLSKAPINLDKYDMYYIKFQMKTGNKKIVRTFCEKGTFPDFKSEELKKLQRNYGKNIIFDFFVKRLIGESGLMNKEGRDDYIYLGGELCKNGYIANRHMIQLNGKTGQQNFDNNLFRLKIQVQAKENIFQHNLNSNTKDKDSKGKTYVIGDIHGMYGSYMDIMKKMTKKDHLIILGDVIDRGTGGIQIIQDIMKRKQNKQSNPEITFMLGNHEMQFLETIVTMIKRGLHKEDLITIMNRKNTCAQAGYYSLYNDANSKREQERWKKEFDKYDVDYQKLITDKGLTKSELDNIDIWLNSNRGNTTIFDYLKGGRVSGVQEQKEIFKFLYNSYVVLPQNINGKDYLFVHAMPPKDSKMIINMKQTRKGYKLADLTAEQYEFMLQERENSTYEQAKKYGFTTICGHTPELGTIVRDDNKGFIRIDSGCGHKQKNSKLALFCVDDGSVEYYDEKETTHEPQEL